jgi:hypothetical protein
VDDTGRPDALRDLDQHARRVTPPTALASPRRPARSP